MKTDKSASGVLTGDPNLAITIEDGVKTGFNMTAMSSTKKMKIIPFQSRLRIFFSLIF